MSMRWRFKDRYRNDNLFNLSEQLLQAISTIISKKEKKDYVCKILTITIPEHEGMVYHSPLTNADIYRNGAAALNGSQIREIEQKYGRYIEKIIPKEEYTFLVVMENNSYKKISNISFKNSDELYHTLNLLSIFSKKYDGILDSRTLIRSFPYLKEFFTNLKKFRTETGRIIIDNNVIEESTKSVLCKRKTLRKY